MPLIYLNDLRLNVRIEGPADGPAVVLLHALGTNLTIWDEVVDLLPKSLRVLRIDQRGPMSGDGLVALSSLTPTELATAMEHL